MTINSHFAIFWVQIFVQINFTATCSYYEKPVIQTLQSFLVNWPLHYLQYKLENILRTSRKRTLLSEGLQSVKMRSMKLVILIHFISLKKTHFLVLAGSTFYQIWLGRVTEKRCQTMLGSHNARVNSHQRWKQTRNRVCFHLWCELTITISAIG